MKILMLIDRMESGGAETHLEALAGALCDAGDEVEIFSAGGRVADRLERCGIVQRRVLPIGRSLRRLFSARRVLKKLVIEEKYDVLHAHTRTMALLTRGVAGWGKQAGSVATVHAAFWGAPHLSRLAFCAERTIAVSEDLRRRCIDFFRIPAESLTVIPNGVDCRVFFPPHTLPNRGTVLFASRLDEDCALGAELLCRIVPRLVTEYFFLQIRIAGGGNAMNRISELAREVNEACRKTVGGDVIKVLGEVENMAEEYRKNKIFVGVSRAAMEASASGCAVILCGNEGRGGLLSLERLAADVDNLCCRGEALPTEAWLEGELRALLENERQTAIEAELAGAWVRENLRAETVAEQTRKVYSSLCDEKGGYV